MAQESSEKELKNAVYFFLKIYYNQEMKLRFNSMVFKAVLTIFLVAPVFIFTASYSHAAQNIVDGDLVTVSPNPDIYIVKITGVKKFKRLILNPDIFNSYGHLKWSNVKMIDQATLDLYKLSELVIEINPDGSVADPKVYRVVSSANSDIGERSWLNLTASEFEAAGYDWDSLYHVNHKEALPSFYPTKTPLTYQDVLNMKSLAPSPTLIPNSTPLPKQIPDALSVRDINIVNLLSLESQIDQKMLRRQTLYDIFIKVDDYKMTQCKFQRHQRLQEYFNSWGINIDTPEGLVLINEDPESQYYKTYYGLSNDWIQSAYADCISPSNTLFKSIAQMEAYAELQKIEEEVNNSLVTQYESICKYLLGGAVKWNANTDITCVY